MRPLPSSHSRFTSAITRPGISDLAVALLLGLLLALSACGGSAPAEPPVPFTSPDVALRDVRMRGVGLTGGALDLDLSVYNPNGYDLEQPRVRYRVYLDDVEVANGFADIPVTVPGRDSALVHVPASFGYAAMGRAGRALMNTGAAPYRVLGRITVGTPYGRLSFPYDRAGRFATIPR